mmetsp:Transcript_1857/g.3257  ORF Transcript_1857/g.3257 Transcript_1857/m.3257 type:complete len:147 (+) Transcript_1857:3-443(+)
MLIAVYCFQGIGRSSFEGALKGTFADFFTSEKEGAFANIILQNGAFTSLGYYLAYNTPCSSSTHGSFCIQFKGGDQHNLLVLELTVVLSAAIAILGYWRASVLHRLGGWNRDSLITVDDTDDDDWLEEMSSLPSDLQHSAVPALDG